MNTKLTNGLFGLVALFMASQINAATTWEPTSGDVDFFTELSFADINIGDADLFLFDDDDVGTFDDGLEITNGGEVQFSSNGVITATSVDINGAVVGSIELSVDENFVLAITRDDGDTWLTDTYWDMVGKDTYRIQFNTPTECGAYGHGNTQCETKASILAVDLQPIPVPAAVWLFGSGLLGLIGSARRRRA